MPLSNTSSRRLPDTSKRKILQRFAGRCALCLAEFWSGGFNISPPRTMRPEMAHFRAWSLGGSTSVNNVIPLCLDHHEKFDKQDQGSRVATLLAAFLEESDEVSDSTVFKVRSKILKPPKGSTLYDQRREIWQIKAKARLGSPLLLEEAEILCKIGQPSEAWEALRILFHSFLKPFDHLGVSQAFAAAGDVALAYGDHKLGISFFRESSAQMIAANSSEAKLLTARVRAIRGVANCLLISAPSGNQLLTLSDLDIVAWDARQAAIRNPAFISGAANR